MIEKIKCCAMNDRISTLFVYGWLNEGSEGSECRECI